MNNPKDSKVNTMNIITKIPVSIALIVVLFLQLIYAVDSAIEENPVRALYLTGGYFHDYLEQAKIIPPSIDLYSGKKIEWTVIQKSQKQKKFVLDFYKSPNWYKDFDIIVHNICFANVQEENYVTSILQAHQDGIPAILIHCSLHSFRKVSNTKAWHQFCGVHSPRHGPKHPFEVKIVNPKHEIMLGYDDWTTPAGELYFIEEVFPNTTILAESRSNKTGEMHPTVWVNEYGSNRTRVFGTTIGHHTETLLQPEYMELITRGFLWALGVSVKENLNFNQKN